MPPLSHGRARADTMMTRVVARGVKCPIIPLSDTDRVGAPGLFGVREDKQAGLGTKSEPISR